MIFQVWVVNEETDSYVRVTNNIPNMVLAHDILEWHLAKGREADIRGTHEGDPVLVMDRATYESEPAW